MRPPLMPVRKSSASASAASPHQSFSSPSARMRSPDNFSINEVGSFTQSNRSIDGAPSGSGGVGGEQKVINSLVSRLMNKLPCNSGLRLAVMETDQGVQTTVQSLLHLAKVRLPLIVQSLASALETLSKYPSSSTALTDTSLDTLHSQLFLLHLLHLCLSASWRVHSQLSPPPPADLPRCWPDPNPLDGQIARHLLSIMLLYGRSLSAESTFSNGTASPAPSRETRGGGGTNSSTSWSRSLAPNSNTYCLGTRFLQQHSYPPGVSSRPTPVHHPSQLSASCSSTALAIAQMTKYTSRIVFYLSASNWPLIQSRIKTRISYLTTTIEDSPDSTELRLLEWSNLNKNRLTQIVGDITTVFLHVKRPAQVIVATMLRRAIWNWIDVYPAEYEALVESNRRLDGGADVLFDVLHSMSDIGSSSNARRTKAFYPLMAMLLVVCPDIFKRATMGEASGRSTSSFAKKVSFLDSLRKGLSSPKGYEAALVCYVDFVRAGTLLSPRSEAAGARSLVLDIQSDLKNALFYSSLSSELSDQNTIVEGLVALYRYDPNTTSTQPFPKLWTDMNESSKAIGIKACIAITVEDQRLPWYPSVSQLRKEVAPAIRGILKTQAGIMSGDRFVIRRIRGSPELPSGQSDVINESLNLYALDPQFAFEGANGNSSSNAVDSVSHLFSTLSSLTVGPIADTVRTSASKAIVALIDRIRETGQNDETLKQLAKSANNAIWQTLSDVGRQLLFAFHDSDLDDMALACSALRGTSQAIIQLLESDATILLPSLSAQPAAMIASLAGFTTVVGPDVEQTSQLMPTLSALGRITTFAHLSSTGETITNLKGLLPQVRAGAFEALAALPLAIGRQQQQKQIRRTLRPICRASPLTIGIWMGLASIARGLTTKIIAADADTSMSTRDVRRRVMTADIEGLKEDESKEWQNLISFLCATVNVAAYESKPPPSISDIIGKGLLPSAYDQDVSDPLIPIEAFVKQCVDLLLCNSITVRESVKSALGFELPTTMCRSMVLQMTRILSRALGSAGVTLSDTFTTFTDQIITILRLSVDRMGPNDDVPPTQVDLGEILSMLGQYLHRLGRTDVSLRLRTRLCQLVEVALQKSDHVLLSNNVNMRNSFLDWMNEWSMDDIRDHDPYAVGPALVNKQQRDLNSACLRAMVPITESLVLRMAGGETDDSAGVVKSRLFQRHYQHLVKVIEKAYQEEGNSSLQHTPSIQSPSGAKSGDKYGDSSALAILVLSNLLSANIDVGLKHCLSLGYHPDPALRTAFMQLLTNVLQQGARFNGLSTKRISSAPKAYLDALNGPSLALAVAMVDVCPPSGAEVDELSTLLFKVFEGNGTLLGLMRVLIEREIAQTNHESELFRANSITMRMLTLFAKTYGYNYVRATLQPFIHSLVEKPAECSFELDPSKASGGDDIERNSDHLRLMCQALLDLICSSTPRVPLLFRALCHHLWEVVDDRFPDSRHSAVGSFIFLRFFCPAIVSPESIDLSVAPDTRETRRALLLITKVIQNLANNVLFKEPHMKVLNSFLSGNIRQVTKFLSDIAIRPKTHDLQAATKAWQDEAEKVFDASGDNAVIHRFIFKHKAKLETSLLNMPRSYRGATQIKSSRTELDGKAAWETLKGIMEETGPPPDYSPPSASARIQMYSEFMRNNQGRNTEMVANVFYEGPASQNSRRIFYLIQSRMGLVDLDLLAYHVFQTLEGIKDYFDIIYDLTDLSAVSEVPIMTLLRFWNMCPAELPPYLYTFVLYNPNSYARRRMKRSLSELTAMKSNFAKNVVAASSPTELADSIPFTALALPEFTIALAYDTDQVFSDLLVFSDHEMQVPVVVKLGHECLHIASWRKQDLTPTIKAYIIDIIRLTDIDDVVTTSGTPHNQLLIKHGQGESVALISPARNEIAQAIRGARARLRETPTSERALRPTDVPATLLNVALLNLSGNEENLRLGSHILINELCYFFKYDVGSRILKVSAGLTIPHNSLAYVHSVSTALATSVHQLTLEFLKEWIVGFSKGDIPQKTACLQYVGPWLANLGEFSKPTREDGLESIKQVGEIVRSLVAITLAERHHLHLLIEKHVWMVLARSHETFLDIVVPELVHAAVNAGLGSDKVECIGDVLMAISSTTVRGKVIARLRKTLAQTYLKPSAHLTDNMMWGEICALARIALPLSFNPGSPLDTQLFLAESFHIITLLLGAGPVLMRQTIYGLTINALQSLASNATTGDMDGTALQHLLKRAQQPAFMAAFGLTQGYGSIELSGLPSKDEADVFLLERVEEVAKFLGEVLAAGAVSIDCANAWRARWMGLVAATCFQHNPATQPQAFTVLGYLASDEVDDDLVYQILVAMSTTLSHFTEGDSLLVVSMLRCLSRIIPGLLLESRYAASLFWLAVGVLELGYVPLFTSALELMITSLQAIGSQNPIQPIRGTSLFEQLMEARQMVDQEAQTKKLDQVAGVTFTADISFSLIAIIYKGVRHPSTKKYTIEAMFELLKLSSLPTITESASSSVTKRPDGQGNRNGNGNRNPGQTFGTAVGPEAVAFFIALLSILSSSNDQVKRVFEVAGLEVDGDTIDLASLNLIELLHIEDNSKALLLVSLVVALLNSSGGTDMEKVVLYKLLADASAEMPDVLAMLYNSLIPRLLSVLGTTSNISILRSSTTLLERAMSDPTYAFPQSSQLPSGESSTSLHQHLAKPYAASISSQPSTSGFGNGTGPGSNGQAVLEDLGMKGLGELNFPPIKHDRLAMMARWVASLIDSFTS